MFFEGVCLSWSRETVISSVTGYIGLHGMSVDTVVLLPSTRDLIRLENMCNGQGVCPFRYMAYVDTVLSNTDGQNLQYTFVFISESDEVVKRTNHDFQNHRG